MSAHPDPPAATGPLWAFAVLLVLGLGSWWFVRAARADATRDALQPWVGAPLPSPGEAVDTALASLGSEIYRAKCSACHALTAESQLGPDLTGVTQRRSAAWIQAMVLRPDSMVRHDPAAMSLKARYDVQMMVPGGIDTLRARAVLEFLRRIDGASAP